MDEFKNMPFIESAEILYGGLFGQTEKRYFAVERRMDHIPQTLLVQQYEIKHLDKQGVRDMIADLGYKKAELERQLLGLE